MTVALRLRYKVILEHCWELVFVLCRQVIMGQLRAAQTFDFSGSADPCAVINLTRGTLNPGAATDGDAVERYVAAISEHVQNALGIPKSRWPKTRNVHGRNYGANTSEGFTLTLLNRGNFARGHKWFFFWVGGT